MATRTAAGLPAYPSGHYAESDARGSRDPARAADSLRFPARLTRPVRQLHSVHWPCFCCRELPLRVVQE